jgi:hypothetical protein
MRATLASRRQVTMAGVEPLAPRKKWWAILVATLLFVPAYWSLLVGAVAFASDDAGAPIAPAYVAFGLALVPFVFVVLAFASQHPRAPGAVVKALALALIVGVPVSALAGDAVTGVVAGMAAGGAAALRADLDHDLRYRLVAIVVITVATYVMLRFAPGLILLVGPVLPCTSLGVADHLSERRATIV